MAFPEVDGVIETVLELEVPLGAALSNAMGANGVTMVVAAEVAAVEVTLLVAVTTTTRVDPTSAAVSV
jgi:hypothetical protein